MGRSSVELILKKGTRVRVIRQKMGHPDLEQMRNKIGTITDVVEPSPDDLEKRKRYKVSFRMPIGSRGFISIFPLYDYDFETVGYDK